MPMKTKHWASLLHANNFLDFIADDLVSYGVKSLGFIADNLISLSSF
jgi:hypothetical protein